QLGTGEVTNKMENCKSYNFLRRDIRSIHSRPNTQGLFFFSPNLWFVLHQVFNDPIHGHMEFHPFLVKIIDTPQFQRLRYLKQLGGAYFVYPGASHNRFEHSLGVAHLAGQLVRSLKEKQPHLLIDERDILCVEIAGLCHDLGHGPFSHLFDGLFMPEAKPEENWKHEDMTVKMFDYIVEELKKQQFDLKEKLQSLSRNTEGDDLVFIKEMINGPKEKVNSFPLRNSRKQNQRDRYCHHLGIKNSFDHNRYIKFARVLKVKKKMQICTRDKEMSNIYEMFHTRSSLHRKAYQHKTNKAVELMIRDALLKADPELNISTAAGNVKDFTDLTDGVFETILHSKNWKLTGAGLIEAGLILQNILSRKLYIFLGETKQTDRLVQEVLLCTTLLQEEDFEITIATFDFGSKDKNPMDNLYYYKKSDKERAIKIPREKVSQFLLPERFSEKWIRVYCKSQDKKSIALEAFKKWDTEKSSGPQCFLELQLFKRWKSPARNHFLSNPNGGKKISRDYFSHLCTIWCHVISQDKTVTRSCSFSNNNRIQTDGGGEMKTISVTPLHW
uniref:HD/PDEase domain-containing protein n=1 Tax=Periophthalmus magnuspinnatus TaxID=409849 RepID=A0A3B3ZB65_9GOBI